MEVEEGVISTRNISNEKKYREKEEDKHAEQRRFKYKKGFKK